MRHLEEEPLLSDLLKELVQEVKTLVKQEIDLVKAEMSQKTSRAGKDLMMVGVGAALAYGGLLILLSGRQYSWLLSFCQVGWRRFWSA